VNGKPRGQIYLYYPLKVKEPTLGSMGIKIISRLINKSIIIIRRKSINTITDYKLAPPRIVLDTIRSLGEWTGCRAAFGAFRCAAAS
jgi:hypothetical protein